MISRNVGLGIEGIELSTERKAEEQRPNDEDKKC